MTVVSRQNVSFDTQARLVVWINYGLEALWLLTVVLVPLAFVNQDYVLSEARIAYLELPKIALLRTLVSLMAVLWLLEWAIGRRSAWGGVSRLRPGAWLARLGAWVQASPPRLVFLAVWLFVGTTVLSTVLSASFDVSMWGEVPGQDGNASYTTLAYVLLFGVVATHLRTRSQLWRLLGAIVVMGTLVAGYAVMEHYGQGIFYLKPISGASRVSSTVGNPILAGAVMLMTIPIALLVSGTAMRGPMRSVGFWVEAALWVLIVSVQMQGIIYTLSRGPWVGTVFSLSVLLLLAAVFVGWRALARVALVLLLAGALTWIVISTESSTDSSATSPGLPQAVTPSLPQAVAPSLPQAVARSLPEAPLPSVAATVASRLASTVSPVSGGGISGRLRIWETSWRLMIHRPWFSFDDLSLQWLRPLIGYGPDFFRYTYLLESPAIKHAEILPEGPRHAHNYFVYQGVELGFLGILTSLGVFAAMFLAGGYQLLWRRHGYSTDHKLVLVALMAIMAGRLLEQMVGVARVSDLTISWTLLGIFVALPVAFQGSAAGNGAPSQSVNRRLTNSVHHAALAPRGDWQLFYRLAAVTFLIAGIATLTWVKTWSYPRGAVEAARATQSTLPEDSLGKLKGWERALQLAPDVLVYYQYRARTLSSIGNQVPAGRSEVCDPFEANLSFKECLRRQIYANNLRGVEQRPFDFASRLTLGDSELVLASVTQDPDLATRGARHIHEAARMIPQSWPARRLSAELLILTGQPETALESLQEFLALTENKVGLNVASFLLGQAYRDLGETENSVRSLELSLKLELPRDLASEAHQILAELYAASGKTELAADHQKLYQELAQP